MKIVIECTYTLFSHTVIELPEGKTWDDVEDSFVKWDKLNIQFKGGDGYEEFTTDDASLDSVDFKRPDRVMIWPADDEDQPDYAACLVDEEG